MKRSHQITALLLVCLAAAAVYSGILHYPFVFDDIGYIADNEEIRSFENFWPPFGTRYLTLLSFALNYHFGGTDPFGYHLVNIGIHILNTVLVFALVRLICASVARRVPGQDREGHGTALAFMVSALFALHPLQTQAVTYTAQRLTSLSALFYLISLASYARWREAGRPGAIFYGLSFLFTFAAQFTKETAFTIPAAIALYEWAFHGLDRRSLKRLAPFALAMLVIPLTLFSSLGEVATYSEANRAFQLRDLKTLSPLVYFLTELKVVTFYLRLLFLPAGQSIEHGFNLSSSPFEPGVVLAFLFLAALLGFGVYMVSLSRRPGLARLSAAAFGILWFFVTISVESSFIPIADVAFEHRVYLPSFGIFLAFSSAVLAFARLRSGALWPMFLLTLLIAAPLGIAAHRRNLVWQSGLSLWSDAAEKSPGSFRVHNNLGHALNADGRHKEAAVSFRRALEIKPEDHELRYNLGTALFNGGGLEGALAEFNEASRLDPGYALAHIGSAVVYNQLGRQDEAIAGFRSAVEIDPSIVDGWNGLGEALVNRGEAAEAVEAFRTALVFDPLDARAHNGLGVALMELGRPEEAKDEFRKALSRMPGYTPASENLERAERGAGH